jgi:hypothetical protein
MNYRLFRVLRAFAAAALLCAAPALAHPPYGLVEDRRGNLYFSDLETVWRLGADGGLAVFRPAVAGTHVHELALAPDGAIEGDQNRYDPATQRFYSGLWRRAEGSERMVVAMTEAAPPGFGIWQDGRGNRYASHWPSNDDRRTMVTRRSADGRSEIVFAEGRPTRAMHQSVAGVGGMAFGADGSLFFADRNLLRRLPPGGKATMVYRGPEGSSLRGIAASPDGRVIAADMGSKAVLAIGRDGRAETLYREEGPWLPTAAAWAGGRLLVLEANADPREYEKRVRLVEVRGGSVRVLAAPGDAAPLPATAAEAKSASPAPEAAAAAGVAAAAAAVLLWIRRRGDARRRRG